MHFVIAVMRSLQVAVLIDVVKLICVVLVVALEGRGRKMIKSIFYASGIVSITLMW